MVSRKYAQLNDVHWLANQYITLGKSAKQISKEVGAATGNSVRQALTRFGIPIRNRSEAQVIGNDDSFIFDTDVVFGSLLGDAGLRRSNDSDLTVPYFYKKNKYYDHVSLVARKLFTGDWKSRIKTDTSCLNGKSFSYFKFSTFATGKLSSTYSEWYKDGIKVIPDTLTPTPTMLHHWFLDDGSSYERKRKTRQIIITLSSQCFSPDDQEMICGKMNAQWGLRFGLEKIKDGAGYRIKLPQAQANDFYDLIGKPLVKSLSYKWK